MPLNDEQVKRDEELKNLEARKNNGEQLTDDEENTLRKGQQGTPAGGHSNPDGSTERTNKGAAADEDRPAGQGFKSSK